MSLEKYTPLYEEDANEDEAQKARDSFFGSIINEAENQISTGNDSVESLFNTLKKVSSPYTKVFYNILISDNLSAEQKFHNANAVRNQLLDDESIPWFEYKSNNEPKIGKSDEALFMKDAIEGLKRRERLKFYISHNQIEIDKPNDEG